MTTPPAVEPVEALRAVLASGVPSEKVDHPNRVIVLEDADLLIESIAEGSIEYQAAREIWNILNRAASSKRINLVVTGLVAGLLAERRPFDWHNALCKQAHNQTLRPLNRHSSARLVRELGLGCNVRFDEGAIDLVQSESGGNIDVLSRLCGQIVEAQRSSDTDHPLATVTINADAVRQAVAAMVVDVSALQGGALDVLDAVERRVLRAVAVHRPKTLRGLQLMLENDLPNLVASKLQRLKHMALIVHSSQGEQLTIPILANWLKHNENARAGEARQRKSATRARVAFALGLGLLGLAMYFVVALDELQSAGPLPYHSCELTVYAPKRATDGQQIAVHLSAEHCDLDDATRQAALVAVQGLDGVAVSGVSGPVTQHLGCNGGVCTADLTVTLRAPGGHVMRLAVTTDDNHEQQIAIENDPAALLKRLGTKTLGYASGVLTFLGLLGAFQERLRRMLDRLTTGQSGQLSS
jgi:hypothetical protein